MGYCDRSTGLCGCSLGFTGSACELMVCPGDIVECNGFGQCLDMNTLASLATNNGEVAGYSYGATPNTPNTWDAFKVRGCLCDDLHTGYDCSLIICPYGDNPVTQYQRDEQQIISCQNDNPGGQLVLSFRDVASTTILGTATTQDVQRILSNVKTMGVITVEVFDPKHENMLCTPTGNQFMVTFQTVHSDLPPMKVVSQSGITSQVLITEYTKGTKENILCSGQGLCEYSLGTCSCFPGFGNSNGMGGHGEIGDCGHIEEVLPQQIF